MILAADISPLIAEASVLTYHNNSARTGVNTNETLLTPANVNAKTFGLLRKHSVDAHARTETNFY